MWRIRRQGVIDKPSDVEVLVGRDGALWRCLDSSHTTAQNKANKLILIWIWMISLEMLFVQTKNATMDATLNDIPAPCSEPWKRSCLVLIFKITRTRMPTICIRPPSRKSSGLERSDINRKMQLLTGLYRADRWFFIFILLYSISEGKHLVCDTNWWTCRALIRHGRLKACRLILLFL